MRRREATSARAGARASSLLGTFLRQGQRQSRQRHQSVQAGVSFLGGSWRLAHKELIAGRSDVAWEERPNDRSGAAVSRPSRAHDLVLSNVLSGASGLRSGSIDKGLDGGSVATQVNDALTTEDDARGALGATQQQTTAPAADTIDRTASAQSVSYGTVLRHRDVQILSLTRVAAKMGVATLSYGAMVYLARQNAAQYQVSIVGSMTYVAALLFGFQGGLVADTLAKRIAIAVGFGAQAAACFIIPSILGTSVGDLMFLMFVVSALTQIVSPGIKAVVSMISTADEVATTGALISVLGSIGSAIGASFLAPLLIKTTNLHTLLYVVGAIFLVGAIRALKLPGENGQTSVREALHQVDWKSASFSPTRAFDVIHQHESVFSMILLGGIVTALYEAFQSFMPVYVREVLDADPADSVYIFAPAGIGFLIGALGSPRLIARYGERKLAVASLALISVGMTSFGLINVLAPLVAWLSPMRLLELLDIQLSQKVLAAGVIAILANFGSSLSSAVVQVFINRSVPPVRQGTLFGMQEVQKNALTIVAILSLGVLSIFLPITVVLVVAPAVVVLIVTRLLIAIVSQVEHQKISRDEAWSALISGKRLMNDNGLPGAEAA
jgi:MFS family permease